MPNNDITRQLLQQNKETLVLDILDFAMMLPEDPLLKALKEPPEGIYLTSSVDPICYKDEVYYKRSLFQKGIKEPLTLRQILSSNEDVVNAAGEIVLSIHTLITHKRFFKLEPTLPSIAIKAGIAVVLAYLDNLCPYTHVNRIGYRLENLVKDEYQEIFLDHHLSQLSPSQYRDPAQRIEFARKFNLWDEYALGFETLLDKVMTFAGHDNWHIYFYTVKGGTLVIEKTCDYRVYSWHKMQLEKEEADREKE